MILESTYTTMTSKQEKTIDLEFTQWHHANRLNNTIDEQMLMHFKQFRYVFFLFYFFFSILIRNLFDVYDFNLFFTVFSPPLCHFALCVIFVQVFAIPWKIVHQYHAHECDASESNEPRWFQESSQDLFDNNEQCLDTQSHGAWNCTTNDRLIPTHTKKKWKEGDLEGRAK